MEPECSLPHSQVSSTCPYHEPDTFSRSPPSHILKINPNIILPSMPKTSKRSLSCRLNHPKHAHTSFLPHTCYMPHPSHSSRFYHPNNIWWAVQIIKLPIIRFFFPFPCYLVLFGPKYSPQHLILKHPQPSFLPQCERPSFAPIKPIYTFITKCNTISNGNGNKWK